MPGDELANANRLVWTLARATDVQYTLGLRPQSYTLGQSPYVLVQVVPLPAAGQSFADVERGVIAAFEKGRPRASEMLARNGASVTWTGGPDVDRDRHRVTFEYRVTAFGQTVNGRSVGHIGAAGVVFVHAYAPAGEAAVWQPVFDGIDDSFRFDPGHAFVPAPDPPLLDRLRTFNLGEPTAEATQALGGVAAGALIPAALVWAGRRGRRRPPTARPPVRRRRPPPPGDDLVPLTRAGP
jgi:hypothetical protein